MITRRLVIVALLFFLSTGVIARASKSESVPPRQSFTTFPMTMGSWQGTVGAPFDDRVLAILGVDEYMSRFYAQPRQAPVGLYVGFYQSQREGDAIHSPMNCLPGAGWQPAAGGRLTLHVNETDANGNVHPRDVTVNRFIIQKGVERQVVLYWYQSQGRVIASEYASKVYMVWDAIRRNRTDAALVRVMSPIDDHEPNAEQAAEDRVTGFTQQIFPLLGNYLPS
jgi:EpsI family protein